MIGLKIAAIAVAALASAALGSDVYLSTHERTALHSSWPKSVPGSGHAASVTAEPVPPEAVPTADRTVFIEETTIHPSAFHEAAFDGDARRPAGSLNPCVDWGASRSPAEEGIWMICFGDESRASSP